MEEGLRKILIPCHLIDIHYLERFLEKTARDGYLLVGFSHFFESGKFRDVTGENYHFCVDLYKKVLNKSDLASDEFEEYKEVCRQSGWTFSCAYKNLVVFYSREEERPMELQTDEPIAMELLKKITLQTERGLLFWRAAGVMFWVLLFAGIYLWSYWKQGYINISPIQLANIVILFSIWGVPVLGAWLQYLVMAGKIKKGIPLPHRKPFWDRDTMMNAVFLFMLAISAAEGYQAGLGKVTALSAAGIGILAVLLLLRCIVVRRGNLDGKEPFDTACRLASIVPVLLAFAAISMLPREGNFRYELVIGDNAGTVYSQTSETERILELGIGKKDLGWDGEDSSFLHSNPTRFASQEWLIYYMDMDHIASDLKNARKNVRYIGTIIIRLDREEQLTSYLKQKKIDLEKSSRFQAVDHFDSYATESGKEMVHVAGRLVVIHFLNDFDVRSFDIEDGRLIAALREKLPLIDSFLE